MPLGRHAGGCGARVGRLVRNVSGAAAVEFALVAPLAVLILVGILQFGVLIFNRNTVQYAVEQAGRYVMVHESVSDQQIIDQIAKNVVGLNAADISATIVTSASNGVTFVTITANYPFRFLSGLLPFGTIEVSGQTRVPLKPV